MRQSKKSAIIFRNIFFLFCIIFPTGLIGTTFGQMPDIVYTSGTYTYSKNLISVPGQGINLNFSVEFKSRRDSTFFSNSLKLPLGRKWLHSYQWQLKIDKDTIRVYNPSGAKERFVNYKGDDWVRSTLKFSSGIYTYTQKDKTTYLFNGGGNLIKIIDATGLNELQFVWMHLPDSQADTVLDKIIDTRGNSLCFSYENQSSRVSVVEYKLLESSKTLKAQFIYTTSGELRKIIDINGDSTVFVSEVGSSNVLSVKNNEGKIKARVSYYSNNDRIDTLWDAAGAATSYAYVPFDTINKGRYSADSMLTITKRTGSKQIVWYDRNQNVVKTLVPSTGYTENFKYDQNGNVICKTSTRPDTGVAIPRDTMMYDGRNNMTFKITSRTVLPFNGKGTLTYDTLRNAYDSLDHMIMSVGVGNDTTRYEYASSASPNLLTAVTDPFGIKTRYAYNGRGLLTEIVDGKGNVTSSFRNSLNGEIEFDANALGEKTFYSYNEFGRKTLVVGPKNDSTFYEYDTKGRVIRVTDALHNTTSSAYDCEDNLISDTAADGSVTLYEYTPNGKVGKTINPLGDSTVTEYNAEDQPVKRINEKGLAYAFSYDSAGRVISVKDPSGKLTTCTYDSANNVNSITDPSFHTTKFYYDETKQLIQRVNALGNHTTISRPKNLTSVFKYTNTTVDSFIGSEYFLFDRGRLGMNFISEGNNNGIYVHYFYDASGNVDSTVMERTGEAYIAAQGVESEHIPLGRSCYTYDRLNRIKSFTDRYGNTIRYSYDKGGNIDTITYSDGKKVTYTYDLLNRLVGVKDWNNAATTYTYNNTGNVVEINLPDSSKITRAYDRASRLISHIDFRGGDTLLAFNYMLDQSGNRISQTVKMPSVPVVNDSSIDYAYNELSQLIEMNGKSYSYDNAGNLTHGFLNNKEVSLTFAGNNQLETIGNDSYGYDYGKSVCRTFARINNEATFFVNDVNSGLYQVLEEQDSLHHIKARYVYGLGLISRQQDTTVSIYHFDPQGNTLALTDMKGTVTDKYSYDPYGKLLSSSGTTVNPYKYGGRDGVRDDGNGLLFMRTRYYSPEMMRFIQMDRVASGEIGCPQTLNLYLYTAGNPLNLNDPNGDWFGIDDLIEAAVGFVAGVVAQGISDLITGETSSWETYLGSGMQGAVTAWTSTYVGPVLGGMLGGAIGNATQQGLSLAAGDQDSWSWKDLGVGTGLGMISGFVSKLGGMAVSKITSKFSSSAAQKITGIVGKYVTKAGKFNYGTAFLSLIEKTAEKTVAKVSENHFDTKLKPILMEGVGTAAISTLGAFSVIFDLD